MRGEIPSARPLETRSGAGFGAPKQQHEAKDMTTIEIEGLQWHPTLELIFKQFPKRSERMAKWNEALRIEEALGTRGQFAGGGVLGRSHRPTREVR
jgi:hypothetical protein